MMASLSLFASRSRGVILSGFMVSIVLYGDRPTIISISVGSSIGAKCLDRWPCCYQRYRVSILYRGSVGDVRLTSCRRSGL